MRGKLCQNLGLRSAPEIRFYRDNTLDLYDSFRIQAKDYLRETNEEQKQSSGVPQEMLDLLQNLKLYRKMDVFERQMVIARSSSEEQRTMLATLLTKEGELARVTQQVEEMIEEKKAARVGSVEKSNEMEKAYKPTRRDKRATREMEKLKKKINEVGNTDFDLLSEQPLNPAQMEESLLGIAADLEPTRGDINSNHNKKYIIDEQSGDKTRLKGNSPKKSSGTKGERKKERSIAFWERLTV